MDKVDRVAMIRPEDRFRAIIGPAPRLIEHVRREHPDDHREIVINALTRFL